MSRLEKYTNIIPILAKGDSLTIEEIKSIKTILSMEAKKKGLKWFDIKHTLRNNPE